MCSFEFLFSIGFFLSSSMNRSEFGRHSVCSFFLCMTNSRNKKKKTTYVSDFFFFRARLADLMMMMIIVYESFDWDCFCLELIEAKTNGCFDLLDEESKLPTPRAEHFTMEVHNRNRGHPRLDVSTRWIVKFSEGLIVRIFSCRENQNYVHRVKYVMMKVFSFNILRVVSSIPR